MVWKFIKFMMMVLS